MCYQVGKRLGPSSSISAENLHGAEQLLLFVLELRGNRPCLGIGERRAAAERAECRQCDDEDEGENGDYKVAHDCAGVSGLVV